MKIYKYQIHPTEKFEVEMPVGSLILKVMVQKDIPYMWAIVNDDRADMIKRTFGVFGTGHDLPNGNTLQYLGSFQLLDDTFVGHLFERYE